MTNKSLIGKIGEDFACSYLIEKGYKILLRNHHERADEIDLIALDNKRTLIFIEVKTMRGPMNSSFALVPEDQLSAHKLHKITRACTIFVAKHPNLIDDERGWQIDLIAVTLIGDSSDDFLLSHYENI